ncbi:MAG TPA: hypothetical protein DCY64_18845 [Hydrogenophaga sp.]|jgi:hypothetical protein|uniref:hypothetical protein n=1 Tax=Hydrogenophaga sp. TaxID=1904254 RepID=UPI0008AD36DC|nr:hypothetical protein [Hydrogenophaga sp.]MBU4283004.1 hypothetical protein [Gammaproteobacteria bacterium]OGA77904.1 MAG: hypothetical protein A2X73_21795 [Burkholderiales bacterium GWE1_65_30]OGA94254.1 MAG: hypothetical protein A2X72_02415 [Burkholderiales bacterium GWF1_66_17]OGB24004.1 MAG: hypothetical protein A3B67_05080 [Burkholderiales bacterium RIFCSPHIGHO2_02_FULL_66_10]OGB35568.1 MAG: hypothetical protein A3I16_00565 [Burkholderiales bacterium RIFCSPLOWO2_02_FULL_66_35]OGB37684.
MRHFLVALMIALLPVRGWVGEAMAFSMQANPASPAAHAGCADHTPLPASLTAQPTPPLFEMASQAADAGTDDDGTHQHGACDICNGPAMAASASALLVLTAMHPQHASRVERFASSELLQGVKPPIS